VSWSFIKVLVYCYFFFIIININLQVKMQHKLHLDFNSFRLFVTHESRIFEYILWFFSWTVRQTKTFPSALFTFLVYYYLFEYVARKGCICIMFQNVIQVHIYAEVVRCTDSFDLMSWSDYEINKNCLYHFHHFSKCI